MFVKVHGLSEVSVIRTFVCFNTVHLILMKLNVRRLDTLAFKRLMIF